MVKDKYFHIRKALYRWGNTLEYCEKRQAEIRQYQELCDDAVDIPGGQLDGMPRVQRTNSAVEDAVVRIVDTYEVSISRLTWEIEEAMRHKAKMDAAISTLSPEQQRLIEMKYHEGCGWFEIQEELFLSRRLCFYRHSDALKSLHSFALSYVLDYQQ